MKIDDFCKFFADIEAAPERVIKGLTVRNYYELEQHLYSCDTCYNRSERVMAKQPTIEIKGFSEN